MDVGSSEFSGATAARDLAAFDTTAKHLHHNLLPVADPENRDAKIEEIFRGARRIFVYDTRRSAGEDHGPWCEVIQKIFGHRVERVYLAVDTEFSQSASDELGDLRAEVDDEEAVMDLRVHVR